MKRSMLVAILACQVVFLGLTGCASIDYNAHPSGSDASILSCEHSSSGHCVFVVHGENDASESIYTVVVGGTVSIEIPRDGVTVCAYVKSRHWPPCDGVHLLPGGMMVSSAHIGH